MTSDDGIRPGDVYAYRCDNHQGYGIMVPVKTSRGWDFIDTYQLDSPLINAEPGVRVAAMTSDLVRRAKALAGVTEND